MLPPRLAWLFRLFQIVLVGNHTRPDRQINIISLLVVKKAAKVLLLLLLLLGFLFLNDLKLVDVINEHLLNLEVVVLRRDLIVIRDQLRRDFLHVMLVNYLKLGAEVFGRLPEHLSEGLGCLLNVLAGPLKDVPHHVAVHVGEHLKQVVQLLLRYLLSRLLHVLQAVLHYLRVVRVPISVIINLFILLSSTPIFKDNRKVSLIKIYTTCALQVLAHFES